MAKKKDEDPNKKSDYLVRMFQERLKYLRRGQEYSQIDDVPKAVECYSQYLNALASYFEVEEEKLTPKLFNQETDITELLLISHVYWDLAKAYDRSKKLKRESVRCLDQFAKFTVGYKYQYVNAQMVRNFLKKNLAHTPKNFKETYEKVRVQSKGCFIATYCFGYDDAITNELRLFKESILKIPMGTKVVVKYYEYSPSVINIFKKNDKIKLFLLPPIKMALKAVSFLHSKYRQL